MQHENNACAARINNESDPIVGGLLQHNKAEVLRQLQEKTEQYKECEQVVVDHMAEKERQRLKEEQEIRERQAAVKVREKERESGTECSYTHRCRHGGEE